MNVLKEISLENGTTRKYHIPCVPVPELFFTLLTTELSLSNIFTKVVGFALRDPFI